MPLSTIDPVAALLVIDLQKGIVAFPTAHLSSDVVAHTARLAKAFRERGLPVVLVNVVGSPPGRIDLRQEFTPSADWAELVPELDQRPGDYTVSKTRWGAFQGTDLDGYLRSKGVTQVFMAGIATSIGVESTARHAYELGYNVVLVTDAMTDIDAGAHKRSVEKMFPRLGETTSADAVLARMK